MPTSHFCKGEWRDGPVSACPRHQKLSKSQPNVYRGIGEPGGRSGTRAPETSGGETGSTGSGSSKPKPKPKPAAGSGSGAKES